MIELTKSTIENLRSYDNVDSYTDEELELINGKKETK